VSLAHPFQTIYASSWQTAKANDAIPANVGSGFSRRTWMAPSSPKGYFRVLIEMQWWNHGSVEGFVQLKYDWYTAIRGGSNYTNPDYCLQSY
jgi:hypothetical protein